MVTGKIDINGESLDVNLFEDGGNTIIYCPFLNIYGYGQTLTEAEHSFEVCFEVSMGHALPGRIRLFSGL